MINFVNLLLKSTKGCPMNRMMNQSITFDLLFCLLLLLLSLFETVECNGTTSWSLVVFSVVFDVVRRSPSSEMKCDRRGFSKASSWAEAPPSFDVTKENSQWSKRCCFSAFFLANTPSKDVLAEDELAHANRVKHVKQLLLAFRITNIYIYRGKKIWENLREYR